MDITNVLPVSMREEIAEDFAVGLEEIRIRVGKPTEFLYGDNTSKAYKPVSNDEIVEMLNYISDYSIYSMAEEIRQGYMTTNGGHRIGITGRTNYGEDLLGGAKVDSLCDISAMNIRIAHERKGCAEKLLPYIRDGNLVYNTFIIAPPGIGKTTFLRDCIRLLSYGDEKIPGLRVGVVDERSEIAACKNGIPQNDLGPRTDVLDNCPKVKGISMLIRSMSPQVIAVDELGDKQDFDTVLKAAYMGSRILGTLHAKNVRELESKPQMRDILRAHCIDRFVELQRDNNGNRSFRVYDGELVRLC